MNTTDITKKPIYKELKENLTNIFFELATTLTNTAEQIKTELENTKGNYEKKIILNELIELEKFKNKIYKLNNNIKIFFYKSKINYENFFKNTFLTNDNIMNKKYLNEIQRIIKQANTPKKYQIEYENLKKEIKEYIKNKKIY